jgi:carnitine monooxygenase subunit
MLHFRDDELLPVFERMREHLRARMPTRAEDVYRVPVSTYIDHDRWSAELDKIFRRKPMPLAFSGELRHPGTYRALTVACWPSLMLNRLATSTRAVWG